MIVQCHNAMEVFHSCDLNEIPKIVIDVDYALISELPVLVDYDV